MTDYRAEAERHLAFAARHLTEHPADIRIAEVAAWIGHGYATLAALNAQRPSAAEAERVGKRYRLTPDHLGEVSAVYRKALKQNEGPTQAVATYFGVPHSTAATWVGHARRQGFLPPTVQGVAS